MNAEIWNHFAGLINPCSVYRISNIRVSASTGVYRPVPSANCISFLPTTVVQLEPNVNFFIPMHKFELVPLRELSQRDEYRTIDEIPVYSTSNAFYCFIHTIQTVCDLLTYLMTDVIGVIEDLEPIQNFDTIYGPNPVVRFTIFDGE